MSNYLCLHVTQFWSTHDVNCFHYPKQDPNARVTPEQALAALEEHAETLLHMMTFDVLPRYLRQFSSFEELCDSISMGSTAMLQQRVNLRALQELWETNYTVRCQLLVLLYTSRASVHQSSSIADSTCARLNLTLLFWIYLPFSVLTLRRTPKTG